MFRSKQIRLLGGAFAVIAVAAPASAKPGDKIAGSYICVFKEGAVTKANANAQANRAAGAGLKHVYSNSIRGFAASANSAAQLQSRNPNIAYCEQDQEVGIVQGGPFDFRELGKPSKPGGPAPAQTIPWGVTRVKGGTGTGSGSGTAWVIDSGIDLDHPDLNVDTGRSRNFSTGTSPEDGHGHGTHVAGTIGAIDNAFGVIGVSPGATLVAVRVLNNAGSGTTSGVIAGVDYVAANGEPGDVANMSLGGGISTALDTAVINAAKNSGVKFTLAAGNESDSATNHSPARANGVNVYTVSSFAKGTSAEDSIDPWSSFSNFGTPVDFAEPGSSIPSTYKGGGYATMSGTSMAAPHLAGILLTKVPPATRDTVDGDPDGNPDPIGTK